MADRNPRWTEQTEQLLLDTADEHIATQNGTGRVYRCTCGDLFEIPQPDLPGFKELRLHQFRAMLAALADTGALIGPDGRQTSAEPVGGAEPNPVVYGGAWGWRCSYGCHAHGEGYATEALVDQAIAEHVAAKHPEVPFSTRSVDAARRWTEPLDDEEI